MAAHLHLHGAFQNDVQLLAHVGGKLDGHLLLGLLIGHGDEEGLGRLVFKQGAMFRYLKPCRRVMGRPSPLRLTV